MSDIAVAARVWRSLGPPGHEHCRLLRDGLEGEVVIVADGRPRAFTH